MPNQNIENGIAEELLAIPDLSRAELVAGWEKAHGQPPPKGISRRLLEYSAAYQIQVKVFGGLKSAVRRRLRNIPTKSEAGTRLASPPPQTSRALSSGTRLVREWHGRTHSVNVRDAGFEYEGQVYASLSKIAREITGTRWSGPRFFGL
tara:strand:- start:297 stop:743 length:447 start_codon:yes stop_codon:yes gene_type:complete